MTKAFFFDLDSTLLQMNQDEFLEGYFKAVSNFVSSIGYDASSFMKVFNMGAYKIIMNDGKVSNHNAFWDFIGKSYPQTKELENEFIRFYTTDFKNLERYVRKTSAPLELITYLKSKGYKLILATNPVFPLLATEERIRWAGLDASLFDDITSYENSRYCKPNILYFEDLLKKHQLSSSDCVMVGNDIDDDFSQIPSGFTKYMIKDYMINRKKKEIDVPLYSMDEFLKFVKKTY